MAHAYNGSNGGILLAEELIVTTAPRDDHQIDLTIELGPERTEQALQRGARFVAKRAKIPGFRPGKAPYATVLRLYGREGVLSEILDDLGQDAYREALQGRQIEAYGRPVLTDVSVDPIRFVMVVPLEPQVELGDYRSLQIDSPAVEVGEADVDVALEAARAARQMLQTVDRPAALDDTVMVDIVGRVGEDTIMDNQDWKLHLQGETGWLPGFDDAFVGLAAGQEKTFALTFPEDAASRYKGQTIEFTVRVKEVMAQSLPEMTDEFVRDLGDYSDLADYRAKKLAEIREERGRSAERELTNAAIEALVAQSKIIYPPAAVDDAVENLVGNMESGISRLGYTLADSLRLQGKTLEDYRAEVRPAAVKRLQAELALAELARREGLTVSAEEEQAEIERAAGQAGDARTADSFRNVLGSNAGRMIVRRDLLKDKALARLKAIVTRQPEPAETATSPADVEVPAAQSD